MSAECRHAIPRASAPFIWADSPGQTSVVRQFRDVWVNADGWVVDRTSCRALRNGGCYQRARANEWRPPDAAAAHLPVRPCVITLATVWGDAYYHFPMDALVGLAALDTREGRLLLSRCSLHVTRRKPYVEAWVNAVLATTSRLVSLVDGTVSAAVLHVPQLGRCHRPHAGHVSWLRERVATFVAANGSRAAAREEILLLVERTAIVYSQGRVGGERSKMLQSAAQLAKRRVLANFDEAVRAPASRYAHKHGLKLVVHSDASLPPLWEQLRRFASARVVVAPLGAAELGLLAARAGTCLVELQEGQWDPEVIKKRPAAARGVNESHVLQPHDDTTYQYLARMLGQQYVRVSTHNWVADTDAVHAGLGRCHVPVPPQR